MTDLHSVEGPHDVPIESDDLAWVIEPDERELVNARAAVRRWLAPSPLGASVRDDIELVVTEATAMLAAGGSRRPIEIRCRYTHSVAVIEATRIGEDDDGARPVDGAPSVLDQLRQTLLRELTTRVAVTTVAGRTTVRCTISLT